MPTLVDSVLLRNRSPLSSFIDTIHLLQKLVTCHTGCLTVFVSSWQWLFPDLLHYLEIEISFRGLVTFKSAVQPFSLPSPLPFLLLLFLSFLHLSVSSDQLVPLVTASTPLSSSASPKLWWNPLVTITQICHLTKGFKHVSDNSIISATFTG